MRKFLFFILLFVAQNLHAQEKADQSTDTKARTAQVNDSAVTYTYDGAGNRIKRVGGISSACLNIWTGNVSASWNNAGNWSLGVVPLPSHTVQIPTVTGKPYPTLDVNTTVSNIRFTGGIINTNNFNITMDLTAVCPN
ncbi:hypothetical protein LZD49_26455 [Dyadobacter sp. CY261]|uniref:hypothetical protein n=1 Tax=Dyadobacter sp. CY261 TaxID=2907203 RepID=UPI001F48DFB4|nr:hypothetical protein [Dyadobacter sp. CY261]MCF0074052.1 hypothetical protein [Dyadobacter sp. CY261]